MNRLNSDHTDKGAAYMLIFFMHIKKFASTLIFHMQKGRPCIYGLCVTVCNKRLKVIDAVA